jgi:hypothetical protein
MIQFLAIPLAFDRTNWEMIVSSSMRLLEELERERINRLGLWKKMTGNRETTYILLISFKHNPTSFDRVQVSK